MNRVDFIALRQKFARTRMYRVVLHRMTPDLLMLTAEEKEGDRRVANVSIPGDVLVYFPDGMDKLYQLQQWLPVIERLNEKHRVVICARTLGSFRALADNTKLPLVFARWIQDVEALLEGTDPKLVLYVNNAANNFQALSWRRSLHVHLNHGESDKLSMSSNQAKAYDVVLVAGEAAEQRYLKALIGFDGSNLLRVGRPQLDLEFPRIIKPSERPTVMYAPTWEGETAGMAYSSAALWGPRLVRDLIARGFRVVYKPHPRVASGSPPYAAAHAQIVSLLREGDHVVEEERSILALFQSVDALLSDVSSVALDWLYLRTEAPLWIIDPRDDRADLYANSPLAERTYVLDSSNIRRAAAEVAEVLETDPRRAEREEARQLYFGDLRKGESTQRFLETMDDLCARRDNLLAEKAGQAVSA